MERLSDTAIDIINELHTERLDYNSEYLPLIDAAQRLAHYEDLEEQGRLVDLPVPIGGKVYLILNPWVDTPLKSVLSAEMNGVRIYSYGVYLNILFDTKAFNGSRDYSIHCIGKTVFLTRSEAEAALAAISKKDGMQ